MEEEAYSKKIQEPDFDNNIKSSEHLFIKKI